MVSGDIIREVSGPVAIKEYFWMALSGPIKTKRAQTLVTVNLAIQGADKMCTDRDSSEDELNKQLKQFWKTETIGIAEVAESVKVANTPFLHSVEFDSRQGKYEIHLPWKSSWRPLSTNYNLCLVRPCHLKSRLTKNRDLAQDCTDIIRQQLEAGIIEKVSPMERDKECSFYLPHHGIIRTGKETTK